MKIFNLKLLKKIYIYIELYSSETHAPERPAKNPGLDKSGQKQASVPSLMQIEPISISHVLFLESWPSISPINFCSPPDDLIRSHPHVPNPQFPTPRPIHPTVATMSHGEQACILAIHPAPSVQSYQRAIILDVTFRLDGWDWSLRELKILLPVFIFRRVYSGQKRQKASGNIVILNEVRVFYLKTMRACDLKRGL